MRGFYTFYKKHHPNNTPSTFNRNLNILTAIYNKAKEVFELNDLGAPFKGLKQENPALHMVGTDSSSRARRSFTPQELDNYIFYLKNARSEICLIGLLMVLTGCRTMEIAGLTHSELYLESNVPFLDIKPNHIRRLKTPSSRRRIPLTHQALSVVHVYLDTCESIRSDKPVFPKYGREKGMDAASAALRKIIRGKMGISDTTLVPYSTRHTMKQKLRAIQTPLEYQREILGHHSGTSLSERGYGEGNLLQLLRAELEKAETLQEWAVDSILDSD